jgi:Iap family predicted aminopeptidase
VETTVDESGQILVHVKMSELDDLREAVLLAHERCSSVVPCVCIEQAKALALGGGAQHPER